MVTSKAVFGWLRWRPETSTSAGRAWPLTRPRLSRAVEYPAALHEWNTTFLRVLCLSMGPSSLLACLPNLQHPACEPLTSITFPQRAQRPGDGSSCSPSCRAIAKGGDRGTFCVRRCERHAVSEESCLSLHVEEFEEPFVISRVNFRGQGFLRLQFLFLLLFLLWIGPETTYVCVHSCLCFQLFE